MQLSLDTDRIRKEMMGLRSRAHSVQAGKRRHCFRDTRLFALLKRETIQAEPRFLRYYHHTSVGPSRFDWHDTNMAT